MTVPIHLHPVCGCFHIRTVDLSSSNKGCVSHKAKNIYYLILYRKSLLSFSFSTDMYRA